MSDTGTVTPTAETPFQAEVARILELMVHSVYSDRDIFLRELISNASDALDKRRFLALTDGGLAAPDGIYAITLSPNVTERTLTIADNGVGMDAAELAANLGTIARSGTKAFLDAMAEKKEGAGLIGRFGVGFYSVFMVADRVEVISRKAGAADANLWISEGMQGFRVEPVQGLETPVGTSIKLFLKDDALNFMETRDIERIVHAYSEHILFPVRLAGEGNEPRQLNAATAIWAKSRSEVKPEELTEFYRGMTLQGDDPLLTLHYKVEGLAEYAVLLFVPGARPFDLYDPDRKGRIKLYVRRVFIADDADLTPPYLRFVRGVVDSVDLPLNISREMLQKNRAVAQMKKAITSRILSELKGMTEGKPEDYQKFWTTFGPVLKEGLYEDMDRRDQLLELLRCESTAGTNRSLKDYVAAKKPEQTAIYYLAGDNMDRLRASPQLEGFRQRGVEVLLLADPVDNFWVTGVLGYDGKPLQSITREDIDLSAIPKTGSDTVGDASDAAKAGPLVTELKTLLGAAISDVKISTRLVDSPACLAASGDGIDRGLEKLLARQDRAGANAKPVLEINATHPVMKTLAELLAASKRPEFEDRAWLLFDQTRIIEGEAPYEAGKFAERLNRLLGGG